MGKRESPNFLSKSSGLFSSFCSSTLPTSDIIVPTLARSSPKAEQVIRGAINGLAEHDQAGARLDASAGESLLLVVPLLDLDGLIGARPVAVDGYPLASQGIAGLR